MFSIKLNGPRLTRSRLAEPHWPVVYGLGSALQIGPTQVMLIANRRGLDTAAVDFEDGADAFVFDRLDAIDPTAAIPLSRNVKLTHPETGAPVMMVQHCSTGGFVPYGALLADGRAHPAAGTGYVLSCAGAHPIDTPQGGISRKSPYFFVDLIQLRFDGTNLTVHSRQRFTQENGPLGFDSIRHPLQNAIPDGEDLIAGLSVLPIDRAAGPLASSHPHAQGLWGRNYGAGFARWRFRDDRWQLIGFTPVTGPDIAGEPTLIRDQDGSLLMAVRGKGSSAPPGQFDPEAGLENTYEHFRVYRSTDNGLTWHKHLHLPQQRCATPVVLSRTAGGLPYLAANPFATQTATDSQGRVVMCTRRRWQLACWPLTADRRDVNPAEIIVDANAAFGPARPFKHPAIVNDNNWYLDHPIGSVCQLAEGPLQSLLCFRVTDTSVNAAGNAPSQSCGLYLEALGVTDDPAPAPIWRFA